VPQPLHYLVPPQGYFPITLKHEVILLQANRRGAYLSIMVEALCHKNCAGISLMVLFPDVGSTAGRHSQIEYEDELDRIGKEAAVTVFEVHDKSRNAACSSVHSTKQWY
jgi:hypothetical protein